MAGNICVETKRLYFATGISNVESAKLLLAAKASVDIKNDDGWEPQPIAKLSWIAQLIPRNYSFVLGCIAQLFGCIAQLGLRN